MAVRWGHGKIPSYLRPGWGMRGSLFAAFAVIAGMAIVISAGAGLVLRHLGDTMVDLSGQDIPRLAASLQLSTQAATLAAQGPAVLASQNEDALNQRINKMKEIQEVTQEKLGEIIELGVDKQVISALSETIKNIQEAAQSLISAARERVTLAAQHDKQYDALRSAQAAFVAAASPAMLDAQTRITAILGSASLSAADAIEAAQTVDQLGNVVASGNLAAADLIAALSAGSNDKLDDIAREYKSAQGRVRSNLDLLPSNRGTNALREAAAKLLALGEGKGGVFSLRQKELDAEDYGQTVLEETRKLNVGLDVSVQQLVDQVQKGTAASTFMTRQQISFATTIMLLMGAATLIGSVLFVWRYVGGNILRRIGSLQRSMQLLSDGDLESEIYQSHQSDEVASMANALQVFRESMIEARALSAEQDKDRAAKIERSSRIEARIAEFEATVRSALDNLQDAANSMQSTAQSMSTTADESNALVSAVVSAAEETSANVQTVSVGTEELSSSIAEIGRQVVSSSARPSTKPARPTPPCRGSPTMRVASRSWSTSSR
jgi:methyl-accepting chemotaxis protein